VKHSFFLKYPNTIKCFLQIHLSLFIWRKFAGYPQLYWYRQAFFAKLFVDVCLLVVSRLCLLF